MSVQTKWALEQVPNLNFRQGLVTNVRLGEDGVLVETAFGETFGADVLVLALGLALQGKVAVGSEVLPGGRYGEVPANELARTLAALGVDLEQRTVAVGPRYAHDSDEIARFLGAEALLQVFPAVGFREGLSSDGAIESVGLVQDSPQHGTGAIQANLERAAERDGDEVVVESGFDAEGASDTIASVGLWSSLEDEVLASMSVRRHRVVSAQSLLGVVEPTGLELPGSLTGPLRVAREALEAIADAPEGPQVADDGNRNEDAAMRAGWSVGFPPAPYWDEALIPKAMAMVEATDEERRPVRSPRGDSMSYEAIVPDGVATAEYYVGLGTLKQEDGLTRLAQVVRALVVKGSDAEGRVSGLDARVRFVGCMRGACGYLESLESGVRAAQSLMARSSRNETRR